MVFSDLLFIFVFLPFFIVTYLLGTWIDKKRVVHADECGRHLKRPMMWRNISLLLFSILFYSWGEPIYIFLMLIAVVFNYVSGRMIGECKSDKARKTWLFIGVVLDLSILGTFKYLGFFAQSLNWIGLEVPVPEIALPIGISFYIFQSLSYLVDVYRRESPMQRNVFDLMLYIAMFPQLIAGPIVRYGTVAEEINYRTVSAADVSEGAYRFFIGLGKKVIFANVLGEIATQLLSSGPLDNLSFAGAWVGIIAFSMQVYFDFSGYSDMAIGLGRSVGFHFLENFNHPFMANSLTDFWRRWHISLGSFFRDYLYIPMGGNRRHQLLNIMTVWFLTGLWHGAYWNYVGWGVYFGLVLLIEKYTLLKWNIPRIFRHFLTIFLILIGFGIFYFEDFGRMQQFFHAFFGLGFSQGMTMEVQSLIIDNLWLLIFAFALCFPIRPMIAKRAEKWAHTSAVASYSVMMTRAVISAAILFLCIALLVGATNNAFIYTRF